MELPNRPPAFKMVKLKEALTGEAGRSVQSLSHTSYGYSATLNKLHKKYGGTERAIGIKLEDIDALKQVREGNTQDLERFGEMLDVLVLSLDESDVGYELGGVSLHRCLLQKLNVPLLTDYNKWFFKNNVSEI